MVKKMTKTQSSKVGKKIKENVVAPPEYKDWEQAETVTVDRYLGNIKELDGMGALTYNFGKNYAKTKQMAEYYAMNFALKTDKGTLAVDLQQVVVQDKSWWDRHFAGSRNTEATVAIHMRGILCKDGEEDVLHKWTAITDINNIVEFGEFVAYQLRQFAETVYNYDFTLIRKIRGQ